jgi:perosamine synthetase
VSLFSFGPIKHRTALAGAAVRITGTDLLARVRRGIAQHPIQKTSWYAGGLLKYGGLHAVSARALYAVLVRMTRWFGVDHDRLVNDLTRGYGQSDFVHKIRQRPCLGLIMMLRRRIQGTGDHMEQRQKRGRMLAAELGPRVICPGLASRPHSFWIFPILSSNPARALKALRGAGFDASVGRSFALVEREGNECPNATLVLDQAIYLPFYPQMPAQELVRMAQVVRQVELPTKA